jgi:hypothetical protein
VDLTWLAVPLGLACVALSVLDIFLTVLHVQAESPISSRLHRALWGVLIAVTRPLPRRARDGVLAWGMPVMVAGLITYWMLLYVVGFGLLYLYFSAVSFLTIGYGDVVPVHPLPRLLAVIEAASGLLAISLSVTYLLSVYPLVARKVALAASLNQELAGRADAAMLAQRYVAGGRHEALGERLRSLNDALLYLGQAHGFYPILYYVRPRQVHESFVRVLVLVQGIVATLRYALDPARHPEVVGDPRLEILEEGLLYTLHALQTSSLLSAEGADLSAREIEAARRDFAALCEDLAHLARRGLGPLPARDPAASAGYVRFRAGTDPYIHAYAANSDYALSEVRAAYSRWQRGSALEVDEARLRLPSRAGR